MTNPYIAKEAAVLDFFNNKASVDEFARAYAYMNCISVRDYTNNEEFANSIEPVYIVLNSDNDGIARGEVIAWSTIEDYMQDIFDSGVKDDIECLYCYLTDKY